MTEWHGGKGSRDRTKDRDKFNESFEKIFGKNKDKGERKKQMSQSKLDRDWEIWNGHGAKTISDSH